MIAIDSASGNTSEFSNNIAVNDIPEAEDSMVTATEDVVYVFSLSDFDVTDSDTVTMDRVVIESLPGLRHFVLPWRGGGIRGSPAGCQFN